MIPFIQLISIHQGLQERFIQKFTDILESGVYLNGNFARQFETAFAQYTGARYCIGCSSGTDALFMMMQALNYPLGSEIILAGNSFVGTALSIAANGYTPVAADPSADTYNITTDNLTACISPNTRALLITHMYGRACNMDELTAFCEKHGLDLLEDISHAHGLKIKGKHVGTFGKAAAVSFYPTKNLGALGDAGAILCNGPMLANRILSLKHYGTEEFQKHKKYGRVSRMDELQAAFLFEKLPYLDIQNSLRKQLAQRYIEGINNPKIKMPEFSEQHVWHLFVIRCIRRDELQTYLDKHKICTRIHYNTPFFRNMKTEYTNLPVTDSLCKEVLSLPLYPGMPTEVQDFIIQTLNAF